MNETNYAQILIARLMAVIIYLVFIITFIVSSIMMILSNKTNYIELALIIFVIFLISTLFIKSIKSFISLIKEIKEKKKFNFYVRNIGQVFMGISGITLISRFLLKFLKIKSNGILIYIILFGIGMGILFLIIDKVLISTKTNNAIIEIDKSDE